MTSKKSTTTNYRYTGGVSPISITFAATGRTLEVARGEVVGLLPIEAEGLAGRTDFEPEVTVPAPTPDTEETPS